MNQFNDTFTVTFYNEQQKKVLYNPPPHLKSVVALPCEIWMFSCTTLHDSYSIQKRDKMFVYSKYLQKCHVLDDMSMPINLQYYSMCSKYPPSVGTHALRCARHFVSGCVNGALLQCCAKRVAGTVAIYCADMVSNDVTGTQKRQLSSNKSIKQKYLLHVVYHS